MLHLIHFLARKLAGLHLARRLEHRADTHILPLIAPCQHRAAAHDHRGDIHAPGRHEHARHDLVAVRDHHEAVKGVSIGHGLNRIADKLAARQRVLHAIMTHRDAIANADGRELHRRAACRSNPQLDSLRDFPQMDMARDNLVERVDHADERLLQILIAVAHGME